MTTDPDIHDLMATRLAELLSDPPVAPSQLSIVDCIAELEGWLKHRRVSVWRRNRRTLSSEIQATFAGLGHRLANSLAPTLDRYVNHIDAVLADENPSGYAINAASATGLSLRAVATTPDSLRASWEDVADAAADEGLDMPVLERRYAELIRLLDAAGHDADGVRSDLRRVLEDDAYEIGIMQHELGQGDLPDATDVHRAAGMSSRDRLELCVRYIGRPAPSGRCITWHAFSPARIHTPVVQLGFVTLLEARWALPNAATEDGQSFPGREELRNASALLDVHTDADERDLVLARVDLGNRTEADAIEAGYRLIRAIADVAALQGDGVTWDEHGWDMLIVDGRPSRSRGFVPQNRTEDWNRPYKLDRTAGAIAEQGAGLAAALTQGLPPDLAEAVRSATEAGAADIRSRVVLHDRVTEMVASYAGLEGGDRLVDQFAATWPAAALNAALFQTVHRAISSSHLMDEDSFEEARDLERTIRKHTDGMKFAINFAEAANHRDRLITLWGGTLFQREVRRTLELIADGRAYAEELNRRDSEGRLLRRRLRRVRNALAHGNPVHETAVQSVDDYSRYLANASLQAGLEAFTNGHDLMTRLRQLADRRSQKLQSYRDGRASLAAPG